MVPWQCSSKAWKGFGVLGLLPGPVWVLLAGGWLGCVGEGGQWTDGIWPCWGLFYYLGEVRCVLLLRGPH